MSSENHGSVSRGFRRLLHSVASMRSKGSSKTSNLKTNENVNEPGDAPSLPFLHTRRPRLLTPTSCQQSPATLGTLARLPPELRRRILMAAFGDRTLHLDMHFAPPRRASASDHLTPDLGAGSAPAHGFGVSPLSPYYFPADDAPPAWRWTSCVCHRMMPPGSRWEQRSLAKGYPVYRYPHTDDCLRGEAFYCALWPPEKIAAPGKCTVGAMGWLLACRQAYLEGIDVLYSTNTYFIESEVLLSNLVCPDPGSFQDRRHLIPPERLASIASLELRWELILFGDAPRQVGSLRARNLDQDRAQLAANLRHLCRPFPNLRSLVLSFKDSLYNNPKVRPAHALAEIDGVLFRPLADAVARLPPPLRQKGVVVEIPSNVFVDLSELGLEGEQKEWEVGDGRGVWLRYPLPSRLSESEDAASGPAPDSDHGGSGFYYVKQGPESDLYWDYKGQPQRLSSHQHFVSCF